jgi:hypothetical protein
MGDPVCWHAKAQAGTVQEREHRTCTDLVVVHIHLQEEDVGILWLLAQGHKDGADHLAGAAPAHACMERGQGAAACVLLLAGCMMASCDNKVLAFCHVLLTRWL